MGSRCRGASPWGQDGDGEQGPSGDSGDPPMGLSFWGTAPRSPPQCPHRPLPPKKRHLPACRRGRVRRGGVPLRPPRRLPQPPRLLPVRLPPGLRGRPARPPLPGRGRVRDAAGGVRGGALRERGRLLPLPLPRRGARVRSGDGDVRGTPPSDPTPPAPPGAVEAPPGLAACFSPACGVLAPNVSRQQCCCSVGGAWGVRCPPPRPCPTPGTAEHRALCPHGTGQTTGPQGSAADVDECRVFAPQLCRGGVCINTAPGFSCYCPSGYYYEQEHLQCVDNDECQDEDAEPCIGGRCVNTVGSYFCSCAPPLVLDGSQRRCVTNDTRAMGEATPCHPPRVTVTPPVSPCPHVSPYPCPMSPWPPIPVSRHCPLMPPPCPHVPHPDVPRHRVPTSCVPIPPWRCIPHVPKSPCPRVPMSHILMSHVTVSPRPVSPYPHGAVSPMSPNPRVPVSPCPTS
ncbi:uncharacterized protein [Anas platyrhynchos]|uniref:uncharacterized protein isoform X1 n=1 Tax=Anas platyrhynchos TaxID=8839 RepID=UPI003AF2460A